MHGFWKRLFGGAAMALALSGPATGIDGAAPDRVGYAYAADSGAFLYREAHFETRQEDRLIAERVVYRSPDGRLLAEKRLDYAGHPFAPRFELSMAGSPYREGLRADDDGLKAFYRPVSGGRTFTELIEAPGELVADGGFDRVVSARFGALKEGRTLTFDFLVPGRLSTYPFRVRPVGDTQIAGQPALHLRMEPASLLLRWLSDPVDVFYHRDNGRLLRYEGPTNLRTPAGDNPRVRVDFPSEPPAEEQLARQAARPNPFLDQIDKEATGP